MTETPTPDPKLGKVISGHKQFSSKGQCLAVSKGPPMWTLAFRGVEWSRICLCLFSDGKCPFTSWLLRSAEQEFRSKFQCFPGEACLSQPSQSAAVFVSGDDAFLEMVVLNVGDAPTFGIPNSPRISCRHRLVGGIRSMSVSHSRVGGVTSFRLPIAHRNVEWCIPPMVSRSVGHIIDHASLGREVQGTPSFPHCVETSRVLPGALNRPICFPCKAFRSGWAARSLLPHELGACWDLPLGMQSESNLLFLQQNGLLSVLPPLDILRVAVEFVVGQPGALNPPGVETSADDLPPLGEMGGRDKTWSPSLGRHLPHDWIDSTLITDKAAKSDDAATPFRLWDRRISLLFPVSQAQLEVIRGAALQWWGRSVAASFRRCMRRTHGHNWTGQLTRIRRVHADPSGQVRGGVCSSSVPPLLRDATLGCDALTQVLQGSWWAWTKGSTLFFWRWGSDQVEGAWDGLPMCVKGKLPRDQKRQRLCGGKDEIARMAGKLEKVRDHGCLKRARAVSLADHFWVPKNVTLEPVDGVAKEAVNDVRMVCNGTSLGLNDALWAPNFFLPNADSVLRCMVHCSVSVDLDLGDFFLNIFMDPKIRPCAGVDLASVANLLPSLDPKPDGPHCERWERCFMGCKPSPHNAIRTCHWAEEFARGNPREKSNPMGFDKVLLNLPGHPDYKPYLPLAMKWNSEVQRIAGDIKTFVDDLRAIGFSEENAWQVARQMASRLQHRGIQNAPRKCRPPSQKETGAWAGGMFRVQDGDVTKSASEQKWNKGKAIVKFLLDACEGNPNALPEHDHKELERKRGFLVHLAMTCPFLTPFLKGTHLTLDGWRPKRKTDGWAMSDQEWNVWLEHQGEKLGVDPSVLASDMLGAAAPKKATAVPRLWSDADAMSRMFEPPSPPVVTVRSRKVFLAVCGFGDASGKGRGSSALPVAQGLQNAVKDASGIICRIGVWSGDDESDSSNWKELTNVVDSTEHLCKGGHLRNAEVHFCTDNSATEAAICKGTSSSPKLLEQIIRLKVLEAHCGFILNVVHVSGKRMIAQGTDGVSRGALVEGVMAGKDMLSFIPLHLSAPQRATRLLDWTTSWAGAPEPSLLSPFDWCQKGHDIYGWTLPEGELPSVPILKSGAWTWAPPPAAAEAAVEELRIARLKRQNSFHTFVCPRLMTPRWLRHLHKAADLVLSVPAGSGSHWPDMMCEPLIVGFVFPFLHCSPWQLRGTPKMFAVEREMRGVWDSPDVDAGDILRKFCAQCRRLATVPPNVVSQVLLLQKRSNFPCGGGGHKRDPKRRRREPGQRLTHLGVHVVPEALGPKQAPRGKKRGPSHGLL